MPVLLSDRCSMWLRAQEAVGDAVVLGPCERLLVLAGVSVFVSAAHLSVEFKIKS